MGYIIVGIFISVFIVVIAATRKARAGTPQNRRDGFHDSTGAIWMGGAADVTSSLQQSADSDARPTVDQLPEAASSPDATDTPVEYSDAGSVDSGSMDSGGCDSGGGDSGGGGGDGGGSSGD